MIAKTLVITLRALIATAVLLLLAAVLVWASMHWLIVPRIDDFRPQLAAWASRALDAPVTVERLSARANLWAPTIVVHGLTIADAGGQPGLQLPRARLDVSLVSLLRGRARAVDLDGPQVWVRRNAHGDLTVAGVALAPDRDGGAAGLRRLLAQPRVDLRGGTVHWVDAAHGSELTLDAVDAALRQRGRRHNLHLDAGSSTGQGPVLALDAQLQSPVWSAVLGDWRNWGGRVLLEGQRLPLQPLAAALALDAGWGVQLTSGQGAVRLRGTADSGQLKQAQAELSVERLAGRLGTDLPTLQLASLTAAAQWQRQEDGAHLAVDDVDIVLVDGRGLSGATGTLDYALRPASTPLRAQLRQVDLEAVAGLAQYLPLPETVQQALQRLQPGGWLDQLDAQWQGPMRAPRDWQVAGKLRGLQVAAQPAAAEAGAAAGSQATIGWPGASGVDVAFDASADKGRASVAMEHGSLTFPGVFEEPVIPVDQLQAKANWTVAGNDVQVHVDSLEVANADAEGHFKGSWRTGDDEHLPGFLDLQGQLTRGDGARVHRYLPLVLPADARHYVRDAIVQGRISDATVRVRGLVEEVPFNLPGEEGIFSIAGRVDDGVMVYVPARLQDAGEPPWPALSKLRGQLEFEGASMRVREASAQVQDHAGWVFADVEADIADFDAERVTVSAKGSGKLAAALGIVRASPLSGLTEHALDPAQASGDARLQLALDLPLEDLPHSSVRGSVQLQQNAITLRPGAPPLEAAQGTITFTESGFALDDVHARALGGPVALSGGLGRQQSGQEEQVRIKAEGSASAAGLQRLAAQPEYAAWAPWAEALRGEATYDMTLDLTTDGVRGIALDSTLQGLAVALPPPFEKPADAPWPLRLRWQQHGAASAESASRLELRLADRLALQWAEPVAPNAPPQGVLALGAAAQQPLPAADQGFAVVAEFDTLDAGPWMALMPASAPTDDAARSATNWLLDRWRVKVQQLHVAGYTLSGLSTHGQRQGTRWQSEVESPDLAGHVTYEQSRSGQTGQVVARLSRLSVHAPDEAAELDTELSRELPSVDLRADRFVWNDLDLGQLDLRARQAGAGSAREWRIDQLLLTTPEARLQAEGHRMPAGAATRADAAGRTQFAFQLVMDDAGALLKRLGGPDAMAGGNGAVTGELTWPGSPLDFDIAGMMGDLHLDLANGRFVKMEPGAGKLFGILSLQALPRRLMLNFNDVFRSGFAFDRVQADARLNHGVISTDDLKVVGVTAAVAMSGEADLLEKTQDLLVYVQPRLDAGAAALAATAINPALGAAAFIAQLALREPLGKAAARSFHISGSWSEPQVDALQPLPQEEEPQPHDNTNAQPAAGENSP